MKQPVYVAKKSEAKKPEVPRVQMQTVIPSLGPPKLQIQPETENNCALKLVEEILYSENVDWLRGLWSKLNNHMTFE